MVAPKNVVGPRLNRLGGFEERAALGPIYCFLPLPQNAFEFERDADAAAENERTNGDNREE